MEERRTDDALLRQVLRELWPNGVVVVAATLMLSSITTLGVVPRIVTSASDARVRAIGVVVLLSLAALVPAWLLVVGFARSRSPAASLRHEQRIAVRPVSSPSDANRPERFRFNLLGVDLREARLAGARLAGADLTAARLDRAVLIDADLSRALLAGARLDEAQLHDARLGGASLAGASLRRAVLRGADLRQAVLAGADLRGADLAGAKVDRGARAHVVVDEWTIWPAPTAHPDPDHRP